MTLDLSANTSVAAVGGGMFFGPLTAALTGRALAPAPAPAAALDAPRFSVAGAAEICSAVFEMKKTRASTGREKRDLKRTPKRKTHQARQKIK